MSTDRGRRRTVRSSRKGDAPRSQPGVVQLAPGVRLDGGGRRHNVPVLVCPGGKVQLNGGAVAILRLCDGSRSREDIVAEVRRSSGHTLAADIAAFLNVARARGWIVET